MRKLFSTEEFPVRDRFRAWRDNLTEHYALFEQKKLGDAVFHGTLEGATIGSLAVSRSLFGPQTFELTTQGAKRYVQGHMLSLALRLSGTTRISQHGRTALQGPDDLAIIDHSAAFAVGSAEASGAIRIQIPRDRLESMLGPAHLFAALLLDSAAPVASLTRTFFKELVRVHETLSPDTGERMASIGVDLVVASLAEHMARETPKPLQGTVTVQRAKAYVEAHLGDPSLDPPQLAAAMGVSLRRLQELFHERGRHISDWIWERRLQTAAQRLGHPGHAHISIGALSYGCGFANQAHFSKRFGARFGVSPREFRRAALLRPTIDRGGAQPRAPSEAG